MYLIDMLFIHTHTDRGGGTLDYHICCIFSTKLMYYVLVYYTEHRRTCIF